MLEPVAARAGTASTSVAETFLRSYTRATFIRMSNRRYVPGATGACVGAFGRDSTGIFIGP